MVVMEGVECPGNGEESVTAGVEWAGLQVKPRKEVCRQILKGIGCQV